MNKSFILFILGLLSVLHYGCGKMVEYEMEDNLQLVFEDSTYQFTGIAKKDGDPIFINYPRWSDIYRYAVIKTAGLQEMSPYPTAGFNQWIPGTAGTDKW